LHICFVLWLLFFLLFFDFVLFFFFFFLNRSSGRDLGCDAKGRVDL
jgi:hypothetical protein